MEWLVIIAPFIQQFLAQCFQRQSAERPQDYLRSHYDAVTGKMDSDLVRDAMPQTRRAVRKAFRNCKTREERRSFPKYDRAQLYDLTEAELIKAMNASDSEVAAVFTAAAALPDED